MTIAQHLATIDRLCAEGFPTGHGGSVAGSYGGPGAAGGDHGDGPALTWWAPRPISLDSVVVEADLS
jgi:hypothetical protein